MTVELALNQTTSAAADILVIAPAGKVLVRIKSDGAIEYGEGYDPDEAARIFWGAVAANFPGFIARPYEPGDAVPTAC